VWILESLWLGSGRMSDSEKPVSTFRSLMRQLRSNPSQMFLALATAGLILTAVVGALAAEPSWKLFRTLQVYWFVYLVLVGSLTLPRMRRHWKDFFNAEETACSLAIVRIIVFAVVYSYADGIVRGLELSMARGPEFFIPFKILDVHKIWPSYAVIEFLAQTLKLSAAFSLVGFMTRASTVWCTVALFFTLGTIDSFGKVDHFHHVLWLPMILAASPSGASLSIDSIVRSLFRGASNAPPDRHRSYGLALRAIWIQLGLLYLSAGIPKWIGGGIRWFWSDNLIFTMHERWYMARWIPEFRIDQFPILVRAGGLVTIALELGIIVLILWGTKSRAIAAISAYLFHVSNGMFLKLSFWTLQSMLYVLVDWQGLLRWMGLKIFGRPLRVSIVDATGLSGRICAIGKSFDVFDTLRLEGAKGIGVDRATADGGEFRGAAAIRAVCFRSPILWPIIPITGFMGGSREVESGDSLFVSADYSGWVRSVATILIVMTVGNSVFTLAREKKGWPFSGYPSFKNIRTHDSTYATLLLVSLDAEGQVEFPLRSLSRTPTEGIERRVPTFSANELRASGQRMRKPESACTEANRVWVAMGNAFPDIAEATRIEFLSLKVSTEPGHWDEEISRSSLLELASNASDASKLKCRLL
jgi:hypothetical protein